MGLGLTESAVDEFYSMIHGIDSSLSKIANSLTVIATAYKKNTRPKGRWLQHDADEANAWECSICHHVWQLMDGTPAENGMNYCQQCGSEMNTDSTEDTYATK